jgi:ribonuclease Z
VPTRARNVSCVALRLPQRGEVWLFDCGEGTQHQILRSDLNLSQVSRIFITHMHGDHMLGLMGLLATCGMTAHASGIDVYGPRPLADYVREVGRRTQFQPNYPFGVHEVKEGLVYEDEEYAVSCAPLKHRLPAFGYRVDEKDRPGHFDVERARELGIPAGPAPTRPTAARPSSSRAAQTSSSTRPRSPRPTRGWRCAARTRPPRWPGAWRSRPARGS